MKKEDWPQDTHYEGLTPKRKDGALVVTFLRRLGAESITGGTIAGMLENTGESPCRAAQRHLDPETVPEDEFQAFVKEKMEETFPEIWESEEKQTIFAANSQRDETAAAFLDAAEEAGKLEDRFESLAEDIIKD